LPRTKNGRIEKENQRIGGEFERENRDGIFSLEI